MNLKFYSFVIDYELIHRKPAIQSSTHEGHAASLAIDGDPSTYSFAAVGGGSSDIGWWQVDLGEINKISSLVLVNTHNDYGNL